MQEASFPIQSKSLARGLRTDVRNPRNAQALITCRNLRAGAQGLSPHTVLTDPFDGFGLTPVFPFPQLFVGQNLTLLADSNAVYSVDQEWAKWAFDLFNADDPSAQATLNAEGPWQFLDLLDGWMLFGGDAVVFKSPSLSKVLVNTFFVPQAACEFKGRVLMGGFDPSSPHRTLGTLGQNYVAWSAIRAGDSFVPLSSSVPLPTDPNFLQRNDFGYMPMPWRQNVLVLKPLGDAVVAYGEDGIAVLTPYSDPPTFGMRKISNVGIRGRCCVGGDMMRHVWIDTTGNLWEMRTDLRPVRLGYQEFFESFDDQTVASFDEREGDVYFATEEKTLVLSPTGLSESSEIVQSLVFIDGELMGISNGRSAEFEVETDAFDLGLRSIKTVQAVQVGATDITNLKVRVSYRYVGGSEFVSSVWKPANREGIAYPLVAGMDFRIAVKGTAGEDAKIDYLVVHYKSGDKRVLRGIISNAGETANAG